MSPVSVAHGPAKAHNVIPRPSANPPPHPCTVPARGGGRDTVSCPQQFMVLKEMHPSRQPEVNPVAKFSGKPNAGPALPLSMARVEHVPDFKLEWSRGSCSLAGHGRAKDFGTGNDFF